MDSTTTPTDYKFPLGHALEPLESYLVEINIFGDGHVSHDEAMKAARCSVRGEIEAACDALKADVQALLDEPMPWDAPEEGAGAATWRNPGRDLECYADDHEAQMAARAESALESDGDDEPDPTTPVPVVLPLPPLEEGGVSRWARAGRLGGQATYARHGSSHMSEVGYAGYLRMVEVRYAGDAALAHTVLCAHARAATVQRTLQLLEAEGSQGRVAA